MNLISTLLKSVSRPIVRMNEKSIARRISLDIRNARDEKLARMVPQSFTDAAKGIISESLNPSLDRFEDIVDNFSKRLDSQIDGVKNDMRNMKTDIKCNMTDIALALAGCYVLYNISSLISRGVWNTILGGLKLAIRTLNRFGSKALSYFLDEGKMQPQSGVDPSCGFILNAMSLLIGYFTVDKFDVKGAIKFFSDYKRRANIRDSLKDFAKIAVQAYHNVRAYLFGNWEEYQFGISDDRLRDWLDASSRVYEKFEVAKYEEDKKFYSSSNYELLHALLATGRALAKEYAFCRGDLRSIPLGIARSMKDLEKVQNGFSKTSFKQCYLRIKPLTILLAGKSGVGKSAVTVPLLDEIIAMTMKSKEELQMFKENNMDFIYSRAPETDFWDGYYGQKAIVIDDFMQANDAAVSGSILNEAFELIRMSNTYPMLLHKAHLEDKGNSYMTSRVILCSTNNVSLQSNTIRENEALVRRFDVRATVYPKLEYCSEETKNLELPRRRLKKMDKFSFDVYEFMVETGSGVEVMNYHRFVSMCIDKYRELEKTGEGYLKDMKKKRDEVYLDALSELPEMEKQGAEMISPMYWTVRNKFNRLFGKPKLCSAKYFEQVLSEGFDLVRTMGHTKRVLLRDREFCSALYMFQMDYDPELGVGHVENQTALTMAMSFFERYVKKHFKIHIDWSDPIDESETNRELPRIRYPMLPQGFLFTKTSPLEKFVENMSRKGVHPNRSIDQVLADFPDINKWRRTFGVPLKRMFNHNLVLRAFAEYMYADVSVASYFVHSVSQFKELMNEFAFEYNNTVMFQHQKVDLAEYGLMVPQGATTNKPDIDDVLREIEEEDRETRQKAEREQTTRDKWTDFFSKRRSETLDVLSRLKQQLSDKIREFFSDSKWYVLGYLVVLISVVAGAISLFRYVNSAGEMEEESYKENRPIQKPTRGRLQQAILNMTPQSTTVDARVAKNYLALARGNIYIAMLDGVPLQSCIFLKAGYCLMTKHLDKDVRKFKDEYIIELTPLPEMMTGKTLRRLTFTVKEFLAFERFQSKENVDLQLVNMTGIRPHRDITNLVAKQSEIGQLDGLTTAILYRQSILDKKVYRSEVEIGVANKIEGFDEKYLISYNVETEPGDCGSVLLCHNKHAAYGKILSLHVGKCFSNGHGSMVPDDIIEYLNTIPGTHVMQPQSNVNSIEGGITFIKKVKDAPNIARKTKLRKSILYEWIGEAKRAPAVLQVTDGVDPFDLCLQRYDTKDTKLDPDWVSVAVDDYANRLLSLPSGRLGNSLLSFEEAVEGISGNRFVNGIPRKTSPGYPWCNLYSKGKKEIFGEEGPYLFDTIGAKHVRQTVMQKLEMLQKGERPEFLYMDAMKDELRSLSKIENLATRMISCCPLDLTILTRMYFGAFNAFMMENCILSGSAVGINPFGRDWTRLAKYLGDGEGYCIAGDFSSFDSTQCSDITIAILDIINDWYDDGYDDIRYMLWVELFNSRHLHGNKVYQFNHCLPSGHPMTSIVNSMFVNVAFRMCYITPDRSNWGMMSTFSDNVKLVAYGDDNICLVHQDAIDMGFNFYSVRDNMSLLGLVYTPEDKTEVNPKEHKRLEECTFLKRSFVKEGSTWVAPLDLDTVIGMPMWYRSGPNPVDRQRDNIDNALNELSMHDEETFEIYGSSLMQAMHDHRGYLRMPTYLLPQDVYRQRCYTNWVDEESLDSLHFDEQWISNVPHPGKHLIDTVDPDGFKDHLN